MIDQDIIEDIRRGRVSREWLDDTYRLGQINSDDYSLYMYEWNEAYKTLDWNEYNRMCCKTYENEWNTLKENKMKYKIGMVGNLEDKIAAIKAWRAVFNTDLKTAKDAIEALVDGKKYEYTLEPAQADTLKSVGITVIAISFNELKQIETYFKDFEVSVTSTATVKYLGQSQLVARDDENNNIYIKVSKPNVPEQLIEIDYDTFFALSKAVSVLLKNKS